MLSQSTDKAKSSHDRAYIQTSVSSTQHDTTCSLLDLIKLASLSINKVACSGDGYTLTRL